MRKKQAGQAFILVLIVLAIGALLVVPSLRLTSTTLMNSPIVERQIKGLYAADAAQEYVLWKLLWGDLAGDLVLQYDPEHPDDPPKVHYDLDVCGVPAGVTVYMRATEGQGGTTLATDNKIEPTKEVTPYYLEESGEELYTYTINLDYLSDISEDNPKVYLDAIYDLPPGGFGAGAYDEEYGSWLSLDSGNSWLPIPDPEWDHAKGYLKWPADYEWDPVVTGAFSSNPEFLGIEDFEEREVKMLRFKMRGTLDDNQVHCNWVVLKMEDGTNTLSGPQAPITVGRDEPGECEDEWTILVTKESNPQIIQPGVATPVVYTISMTNLYNKTRSIREITDYLPPGFEYVEFISSEMVDTEDQSEEIQILELYPLAPDEPERSNPLNDISIIDINGIDRQQLRWRTPKFPHQNDISFPAGYTFKLKFRAMATKDVSGSYYNEVIVILKESGLPSQGFAAAGVLAAEFGSNYSWLTGAVMVPAYDSSSESEGITIDANMSLVLGGITITSWQVR